MVSDHHLVQVLDQERVAGLEDQHIVVHLIIHYRNFINMHFFTWSTIHSTRKELSDDGRYIPIIVDQVMEIFVEI